MENINDLKSKIDVVGKHCYHSPSMFGNQAKKTANMNALTL